MKCGPWTISGARGTGHGRRGRRREAYARRGRYRRVQDRQVGEISKTMHFARDELERRIVIRRMYTLGGEDNIKGRVGGGDCGSKTELEGVPRL